MKARIKKLVRQFLGFFPSKIPVGVEALKTWTDEFIETYDLATKDRDSVEFCIAATIINLGPQVAYKPKFYFYLTFEAGAAKQVAGSVFYEIKIRQKALEEAAKKAASESTEQAV